MEVDKQSSTEPPALPDATTVTDGALYLRVLEQAADQLQVWLGYQRGMRLDAAERLAQLAEIVRDEVIACECTEPECHAIGIIPQGEDGLFCVGHDADYVRCGGCGRTVRVAEAHWQDGACYHRGCLPESYADYPFVAGVGR